MNQLKNRIEEQRGTVSLLDKLMIRLANAGTRRNYNFLISEGFLSEKVPYWQYTLAEKFLKVRYRSA